MTGDPLGFDREHLWHPYSSMTAPAPAYLVASARGNRIALHLDGADRPPTEVLDAMSSWWCAIHGYAVPELDAAARTQLDSMSHVMFGGLTHEPAIGLARRLLAITADPSEDAQESRRVGPTLTGRSAAASAPGLQHVFLADSGSVAVEVAMKMAWQAHAAEGLTRTRMFTVRGGYHGDTFAAMSVCDPDGGMHSMYGGLLPQHLFADRPPAGVDLAEDDPALVAWRLRTQALFEQHAHEIAAVIIEPVLQGAGGMHLYSPHAVRFLADLAREHGALLILDEIATGLWRTGTRWAADRCGVAPDILCVGKALTGGYLSLAAVLTTSEVAARVDASPAGAMMHGPTFMANPLACAVACASLDLLTGSDPAGRVARIETDLAAGLGPARDLSSVADVRVLGATGVLELDTPVDVAAVTRAALDAGVWVRPFRNLVYTMPPYTSSAEDLAAITAAVVGSVAKVHG